MPTSRTMASLLRQYAPRSADADLLAQFVATRDDDAFAELARRHGPAILAVCRRITGNQHDADDAFQVAFLVLARKADRVRPATLGGWLYGVAVRAARKALARSCRRRNCEVVVGELPEVPQCPAICDPDADRVVLEEVARLPDDQREAVVLCELEGRPRSLAARELGIPEGTLSSRLAAARKRLATRLRDRGLAPAVLAAVAGTAAHPVLAVEAARLGVAPVSTGTEIIMEAVMRSTFVAKLKLAAVAVTAVAAVVLSVVGAEPSKQADPPLKAQQRVDAPAPGGRLLLVKDGGFDVVAPDGKVLATIQAKDAPGVGALSPDGKQVAYLIPKPPAPGREQEDKIVAVIRDALGGRFVTTVDDVDAAQLCWSPDGKALYGSWCKGDERMPEAEHCRIDLAARTVEKVDWPASVRPLEWARDGKSVLVCRIKNKLPGPLVLALMSPDGKTLTDLVELRYEEWVTAEARLSPDGCRLLFSDIPPGKKEGSRMIQRLYVYDVATKKRTEVAGVPPDATVFWCCWSPDGKKIAYVGRQRHDALVKKAAKGKNLTPKELATRTETFVIVANADGSDARTVASVKVNSITDLPFDGIDWR